MPHKSYDKKWFIVLKRVSFKYSLATVKKLFYDKRVDFISQVRTAVIGRATTYDCRAVIPDRLDQALINLKKKRQLFQPYLLSFILKKERWNSNCYSKRDAT